MKKGFIRLLSLTLFAAMCLSMTVVYAAGAEMTLKLDVASAEVGSLPEKIRLTIATSTEIDIASFGGEVTVSDSRIVVSSIEEGDRELTASSIETGRFARVTTKDRATQEWATVVFAIPADLEAGTYTISFGQITCAKADGTDALEDKSAKSVTFTVSDSTEDPGDEPDPGDGELSYVAGLDCDTETIMTPGSFEVEVFVNNSFASAEFTIAYDSDLLKFQENDSELYGADFTNKNGTLKFWDYGDTQNHGYTLCFKAAEGAGEAEIELIEAAFSTQEKASVENLTRATIPAEDSLVTVEIAAGNENLTVEVEGAADAGVEVEADTYYTEGKAVTIQLKGQEVGYLYTVTATVNGGEVEVIDNGDGTYTIAGENVVAGGIIFNVTKMLDTSSVKVSQYVKMNGATMYLVTCGVKQDGKVYTYDGADMFWSDAYDSYCYLVIDSGTFTTDTAKAQIGLKNGTAVAVDCSNVDVNMTNQEDANDAQLVYNMYNAMYSDFSVASMEKFLRADVNNDKMINVDDAAAIIAELQ